MFYPGVPPADLQLVCPSDEMQWRYDGHLGRYDSLTPTAVWTTPMAQIYPVTGVGLQATVWVSRICPLAPELAEHILRRRVYFYGMDRCFDVLTEPLWCLDVKLLKTHGLSSRSMGELTTVPFSWWGCHPEMHPIFRYRCWLHCLAQSKITAWLIMARLVLADPVTLDMGAEGNHSTCVWGLYWGVA